MHGERSGSFRPSGFAGREARNRPVSLLLQHAQVRTQPVDLVHQLQHQGSAGEIDSITPIRRQVPVEDYLKPQRRFAHLFAENADENALKTIQSIADRNIRRFNLIEPEAG